MNWTHSTPEAQALLSAWEAATKLPRPSWTYERARWLDEAVRFGATPEDIAAVARFIRSEQDKPRGLYGPTSLLFRCMMDPEKLEENVALVRSQRPQKREQVPHLRVVGSDTVAVLDDPTQQDGHHIAEQLRALREKMGGAA